jgi:diaminopimelate epimerase
VTADGAEGRGGIPRSFTKMSGAGNDFLVFGVAVGAGPHLAAAIRSLCRRGTGVGADGVLFLSASGTGSDAVVVADYRNADGGAARFCANGTRCAARYAVLRMGCPPRLTVRTGWGDVVATVRPDGLVSLGLPEPVGQGRQVATPDAGRGFETTGIALWVGVPHLVIFADDPVALDRLDLASVAPALRHHPDLPDGANVHFVAPGPKAGLVIRSWERGVEGETLACGSGVVAAAVVAAERRGVVPPVTLRTRSGRDLVVDFRLVGDAATEVTLCGDARVVFEGQLSEEVP